MEKLTSEALEYEIIRNSTSNSPSLALSVGEIMGHGQCLYIMEP